MHKTYKNICTILGSSYIDVREVLFITLSLWDTFNPLLHRLFLDHDIIFYF